MDLYPAWNRTEPNLAICEFEYCMMMQSWVVLCLHPVWKVLCNSRRRMLTKRSQLFYVCDVLTPDYHIGLSFSLNGVSFWPLHVWVTVTHLGAFWVLTLTSELEPRKLLLLMLIVNWDSCFLVSMWCALMGYVVSIIPTFEGECSVGTRRFLR